MRKLLYMLPILLMLSGVVSAEEGYDWCTKDYLTENMQKAVSDPQAYMQGNLQPIVGFNGIYWDCRICDITLKNTYNGRSGIQPLCENCANIFDIQRKLYLTCKPLDCSDEKWWHWRFTGKEVK